MNGSDLVKGTDGALISEIQHAVKRDAAEGQFAHGTARSLCGKWVTPFPMLFGDGYEPCCRRCDAIANKSR